jgi:hypothetical protein
VQGRGSRLFRYIEFKTFLSSNIDSVVLLPFQLNILRAGHHLLKEIGGCGTKKLATQKLSGLWR